ncbi:MAG: response regulator transcription factor [Rhizobiales bacterium]|nr:response regulator transcription factor [Hyphomicrobiales bacterium]OJY01715.1 MAG: DNA-binding response regulator [Rhizobiales bacterium 63-22]
MTLFDDAEPTVYVPTVYVIDDDASVCAALKDLFESIGLRASTFPSVAAFLEHPRTGGPSCLVLDVRMPGQSGLDFHLQMEGMGFRTPVVFITAHGDIAMGVKAIKAGAVDFLTKPFRDQELLDAVHAALDRDRRRMEQDKVASNLKTRWETLSVGEREVFALVVTGLLNKQIASELDIKEVTVKVRRARIMQKMSAASLADLVRMSDQLKSVSSGH